MQSSHSHQLSEIIQALPREIEFYHLGKVELQQEQEGLDYNWTDTSSIAFRIQGERKALIILLFGKGLDESVYSEFGNLLVSKIANQLSSEQGLEVAISPPLKIATTRVEELIRRVTPLRKTYVHFYKNSVIPIETLILPTIVEEIGYA